MIIVADASPLVALALCDCLEILPALFGEVAVSQLVYQEVSVTGKPGADRLRAFLQGKIHSVNLDNFIIGGDVLDEGELTSIALYKHLQALTAMESAAKAVSPR